MEYVVLKQQSNINNVTYCKAQLVNIKSVDQRRLAKMLSNEGSTVSESDISAVLTLLGNRLPQLMAMGYKFDIPGIGTFCPTVSGSITESDWREARVKKIMADDSSLTEAAAKAKQQTEEFKKSCLTSKMLTLSYKVKTDAEFEQALQNANEWERKDGGTVDEDSSPAQAPAQNTNPGGGNTDPSNPEGGMEV